MRDRDSLILESLYSSIYVINEAEVLRKERSQQIPLKDNQTIRIYHGIENSMDLKSFLEYGTSGKIRAGRNYSYEANNNPNGLFVTIDLNIAKRFGNKYIIEFHSRVSDLEAPVWPSGAFTVQGQESQSWNSPEEREEYRNKLRMELKNDSNPVISKSDRPELADSLYNNSEHQALYVGDLNSNSIRAIWVSKTPEKSGNYSEYEKYDRKSFLKKFKDDLSKEGYSSDRNKLGKYKFLKPREDVTVENLINGILKNVLNFQKKNDEERVKDFVRLMIHNKDLMRHSFWPHQIDAAWNIIEDLKRKLL
jgi:hypothetical protein